MVRINVRVFTKMFKFKPHKFPYLKNLGANLQVEKLHRLQWNVMNEVPTSSHVEGGGRVKDALGEENGWLVMLQPFQIRTFIIDLNAKL